MDGYALARALRARPGMRNAVLVALTGYGQPQDREAAFAAGFDAHCVKPIEPQQLDALLARAVQMPDDDLAKN
jgi:CheY-like chemotaxis protein